MSLGGLCMFTELVICHYWTICSLRWTTTKIRNVPVLAMPPEIRTTVHVLSGRTTTMSLFNGIPNSVHKCKRKEKFGCTGIFGGRIFYKHLQWRVDQGEWKRKTFPKEEKSISYWKDIIFMLVLLLLLLLLLLLSLHLSLKKFLVR